MAISKKTKIGLSAGFSTLALVGLACLLVYFFYPKKSSPASSRPADTPTGGSPTDTPTGGSPTDTPTGGSPTDTPTGGSPTDTPTEPPPPPPPSTCGQTLLRNTEATVCHFGSDAADLGMTMEDLVTFKQQQNLTGLVQIVNASKNDTMWIRYSSGTDKEGNSMITGAYNWVDYAAKDPKDYKGNSKASVKKNENFCDGDRLGKTCWPNPDVSYGQGGGFTIEPGGYRTLPFVGAAAWFGAAKYCKDDGSDCLINNKGRGAQFPTTLFEWTVSNDGGVWDVSAVNGYNFPMKVEIAGLPDGTCVEGSEQEPCTAGQTPCTQVCSSGNDADKNPVNVCCLGTYWLGFSKDLCKNNKVSNPNGDYVGCAGMCDCQTFSCGSVSEECKVTCSTLEPNNSCIYGAMPGQDVPEGYENTMTCDNSLSAYDAVHLSGGANACCTEAGVGWCNCNCPGQGCECAAASATLYELLDTAGRTYCEDMCTMTQADSGMRQVYCQSYDDKAGTKSYNNTSKPEARVLKVTICDEDFQWKSPWVNPGHP